MQGKVGGYDRKYALTQLGVLLIFLHPHSLAPYVKRAGGVTVVVVER